MTSEREPIEYPDEAGYPDGQGFLDEGTADAGTADAGAADAGTADAGTTDAGTTDAGTADESSAHDAAPPLDDVAAFADSDQEDDDPDL